MGENVKFKQLGDIKEIGLVFICVLPCFLLYLKTQHSLFVTMGLIASSSIIVFYKIRFGFINVLFHLLQILFQLFTSPVNSIVKC